jgi:hypothetical protein
MSSLSIFSLHHLPYIPMSYVTVIVTNLLYELYFLSEVLLAALACLALALLLLWLFAGAADGMAGQS